MTCVSLKSRPPSDRPASVHSIRSGGCVAFSGSASRDVGRGEDGSESVALGAAIHAGSLEGSIENVQTLNSMQASLIRALTAKMKRDDTDGDWDDDTSCVDGDWDESCEEDWGPENLDELLDFEDEGPRSS